MSIDLSRVTGISDSRGVITEIKDSLGRVIWSSGTKVSSMVLRPSADISVEHNISPADSAYAYLLINEEVADGSSTYICSYSTSEGIQTSKFKLSGSEQPTATPFTVTSVNIIGQVYSTKNTGRNDFYLEINGESTSVVTTTGGKTDVFDLPVWDAIGILNDAIATSGVLPNINIVISSYTFDEDPDKIGVEASGVSQVYVVLGYEA